MLGDFFDPNSDIDIREHCRPHWSQAGTVVFITFRTADSLPRSVILRWEQEKKDWLMRRGFSGEISWKDQLHKLPPDVRRDFQSHFNRCREDTLDTCLGKCELRNPELARIVHDSLMHFDNQRYRMGDFVIMPNHVHLLAAFFSAEGLRDQVDSWLHFTAFQINKRLNRKGHFWQEEPFDHLVRSPEQYDYLREYIQQNPHKARLKVGDYLYRRYQDSRRSLRERE